MPRGAASDRNDLSALIVAGATQRFGTEAQKEEILGGIAGGAVEAIAMTEPEAGSDVGALSCKAEAVDDGFLINGQKVFCSNAHISDHVLVVCRTDNAGGKPRSSAASSPKRCGFKDFRRRSAGAPPTSTTAGIRAGSAPA